jgi:alpha-galactosidase
MVIAFGRLALALLLASTAVVAAADDLASFTSAEAPSGTIPLEALDLTKMTSGWGTPQAARSSDRHPITIAGHVFPRGVGTHAASEMILVLDRSATRFESMIGIDDECKAGGALRPGFASVTFEAWVDGRKVADSGLVRLGDAPRVLSADLTGAERLILRVTDAGDGTHYDHADWAGAVIQMAPGARSRPVALRAAPPPLPAIAPAGESLQPAIHGPRVVGATPERPFVFRIPATGAPPLAFAARGLPEGLTLDPGTGILSGVIARPGSYDVDLAVTGPKGTGTRRLSLVAGDRKLALTPPMGWNSWNVWGTAVTEEKIRRAADALIDSGLAAHGFRHVNIDDAWMGTRDASGAIRPNEKFGDIKALADYVHSKGLLLGIYSSPGPKTCGGYEGSFGHEAQDARTWAAWGIDYLKYDWCSYGDVVKDPDLEAMRKPYRVMRAALDATGRDVVFSFCQYGMGNVWEWGSAVGGNLWRTTGDMVDNWDSLKNVGFGGGTWGGTPTPAGIGGFGGPGHWNDPDMLVVGKVGWGPSVHPTGLTGDEQVTHMTLWALQAAPLLVGADLTALDPFTLALLTNDDVLDVDQDPLGKGASRRSVNGETEVWARPLADGTIAVGLFNRGDAKTRVTARWADLGISGSQPVRDLWLRKDLAAASDEVSAEVASHGAQLLRVGLPHPSR